MNKCGFISVLGRPNAGKSSLLNYLLGQKLALVSHKANATRKRANIIIMHKKNQLIFVDTPGLHKAEKLLNQFMLSEALKAMGDCDLALFLAPASDKISYYEDFLEEFKKLKKTTKHILILSKVDTISSNALAQKIKEYEVYKDSYEELYPLCIKNPKGLGLLDTLAKYLPEHPYLFDEEILTSEHLRDIYKEFIREAIFDNISDEIPYESDVLINKIEEKENIDVIKATIIVQKDSQKGMIIGKGARAIKRIGKCAREKIEILSEKKCYLELFVSVKKSWSKDAKGLKSLGYDVDKR